MTLLKSAGRLLGIPKEADLQPRRILLVIDDTSGNVGYSRPPITFPAVSKNDTVPSR